MIFYFFFRILPLRSLRFDGGFIQRLLTTELTVSSIATISYDDGRPEAQCFHIQTQLVSLSNHSHSITSINLPIL